MSDDITIAQRISRIMASAYRDEMLKIVADEINVNNIAFNGELIYSSDTILQKEKKE